MLAIKLARVGRKNCPFFRIIVLDKRKDTFGAFLENVGTYNPKTKELNIKAESIKDWLSKGAQPTKTVHNILVSQGIIDEKKVGVSRISKKRKAKLEAKKSKKAEAAATKQEAAKTDETPAPVEAKKVTETKAEEKPVETKPAEATPVEEPKKEEAPKEEVKEEKTEDKPAEEAK
jgi:small subunit ribosomal protein S16